MPHSPSRRRVILFVQTLVGAVLMIHHPIGAGGLLLHAAEPSAAAAAGWVWFGTYTGTPPLGSGVYVARFDPATGILSHVELAATLKNPSFLALHPRLPVLYAVSEVTDGEGKAAGAVVAFAIDPATGLLRQLNQQSSGGAGPCHLSVDPTGRVLLVANYGGGSVLCLGIGADGSLQAAVEASGARPGGMIQHVLDQPRSSGIDPERQAAPHAHSIDASADGRFALACDLGCDRVFIHALDVNQATLQPHRFATLTPGAGPRHLAFHPQKNFAYCINELNLTVTAFAFDPQAGTLLSLDSVPTLPAEVVDRRGISTAEIVIHPSGKFLYGSNRGHNSVAIYTIDAGSGRLSLQGVEPIRGTTPRHFAIDPSGRYLLAAGQNSGTVSVFAIDQGTGRLSFAGHTLAVTAPVCILFAGPALAAGR